MTLRKMIGLIVAGLTFATASCVSVDDVSPSGAENILVIKNVTAIDAVNGGRDNVDVVIVNDKIIATGSDRSSEFSGANVSRIDGSGKYLIPGLWDAHVHLAYTPGLDHRSFFPLSLAYGVTSLRDTGGHLDQLAEARAIANSDAIAPNLFVAGPLIDGAQRVYAGQSPGNPDLSVGAATVEDAIRQVNQLAAQKVDFIKAYEMLSPEAFRAVVKRSKELGLPVTAHSPLSMTATQAILSGISDMQHLRNLEMDCTANPDQLLAERQKLLAAGDAPSAGRLRSSIHAAQRMEAIKNGDAAACNNLIALLAENKVSQTPTLTVTRFLTRKLYAEERWRQTFALVPKKIGDGWLERSSRLADRQPTDDNIAFDVWIMNMVKKLHDAGVPIMAGTDAPIGYLTPGASLHEELAMFVDAGLTPLEALRTATITPAAFFGLEGEMGQISSGMKADLVLLDANPLADIRNSLKINAVIKDGRYLDRARLNELRKESASIN